MLYCHRFVLLTSGGRPSARDWNDALPGHVSTRVQTVQCPSGRVLPARAQDRQVRATTPTDARRGRQSARSGARGEWSASD